MRRDQLEIGLEREYALHAWADGTVSHLLANDRLLASFDAVADHRWRRMHDAGWRLAPEYSRCLVELSSPPCVKADWPELLAGFALVEGWLARAAERLTSRFERIECTADYSLRTDRFVTWDGAVVTDFAALLLDSTDANLLVGDPDNVPPCLGAAELGYAGFTSTNATLHAPMPMSADALARYYWRLLRVGRQIEVSAPRRHALLRDGKTPVAPDPDRSIRDALIRWGEPHTARLLDTLSPDDGLPRFRELFGQEPSAAFTPGDFHAYSCRPRVVDGVMLFELRCFHSGVPLANLAPLLEVPWA